MDNNELKRQYLKELFVKNQDILLLLANSEVGKFILNFNRKEQITKITPNAFHYYLGQKDKKDYFEGRFYPGDILADEFLPYLTGYDLLDYKSKPIGASEAIEFFAHLRGLERSRKFPQFLFSVTNFGTTSGCGTVRNGTGGGSFASIMAAASGDGAFANGASGVDISWGCNNPFNNATYYNFRGFVPTDTSSIPDNNVISAARLVLYITGIGATLDSNAYSIICKMQADSPTTLGVNDWNNYDSQNSPVEWASRIAHSSMTLNALNYFSYNTAGLAQISKTGYTYNGLRDKCDVDGIDSGNNDYGCGCAPLSNADSAKRPYLEVTYAALGGGFLLSAMFS